MHYWNGLRRSEVEWIGTTTNTTIAAAAAVASITPTPTTTAGIGTTHPNTWQSSGRGVGWNAFMAPIDVVLGSSGVECSGAEWIGMACDGV